MTRQDIIKALMICYCPPSDCTQCPYHDIEECNDRLGIDALEMLLKDRKTKINLNEKIKVRLTDYGRDIYYHQFDMLNEYCGKIVCKPRYPKEDLSGYTRFQLWEFIELYGPFIGMAKPNVIEPLEIIYEEEDNE